MTGGFAGAQRDGWFCFAAGGSSTQISVCSSAISTNSRFSIFLAIFGGRAAAGLYGPSVGSNDTCAVAVSDTFAAEEVAAATRRSRPDAGVVDKNVGIVGSPDVVGSMPREGSADPVRKRQGYQDRNANNSGPMTIPLYAPFINHYAPISANKHLT